MKEITLSSSWARPGICVLISHWLHQSGYDFWGQIHRVLLWCCQIQGDLFSLWWPQHSHSTGEDRAGLDYKQGLVCSPLCPCSLYSVCFVNLCTKQARWARRRSNLDPWLEPNQNMHMSQARNNPCWLKGCDSQFLPEKAGDWQRHRDEDTNPGLPFQSLWPRCSHIQLCPAMAAAAAVGHSSISFCHTSIPVLFYP